MVRKVFSGDAGTDQDRDGRSALLEYAYGTSDQDPADQNHGLSVQMSRGGFLEVVFPRDSAAEDVQVQIEVSENLEEWKPLNDERLEGPRSVSPEDIPKERWRLGRPDDGLRYLRVRASLVLPD